MCLVTVTHCAVFTSLCDSPHVEELDLYFATGAIHSRQDHLPEGGVEGYGARGGEKRLGVVVTALAVVDGQRGATLEVAAIGGELGVHVHGWSGMPDDPVKVAAENCAEEPVPRTAIVLKELGEVAVGGVVQPPADDEDVRGVQLPRHLVAAHGILDVDLHFFIVESLEYVRHSAHVVAVPALGLVRPSEVLDGNAHNLSGSTRLVLGAFVQVHVGVGLVVGGPGAVAAVRNALPFRQRALQPRAHLHAHAVSHHHDALLALRQARACLLRIELVVPARVGLPCGVVPPVSRLARVQLRPPHRCAGAADGGAGLQAGGAVRALGLERGRTGHCDGVANAMRPEARVMAARTSRLVTPVSLGIRLHVNLDDGQRLP
mmetsp:Transcript_12898/g.24543  ORF Transcript_12898/g.24543 Transcript_12898/m.24543 type:complete len:375 (-) Transcript_12898:962-2086(-)